METIEEKYNAMVRRCRELYESGNTLTKLQMEVICPELRESEDERIRKEIISAFKFWFKEGVTIIPEEKGGRITVEQAIAYLEKQKEQKPNIEICPHSIKSKSYKENDYPIEDCDYGLEIAFDILEKTFGEVRGYQTDDGIREHQTAIEAVRKAKEQKPAEWNDKDKTRLTNILIMLQEYVIHHYSKDDVNKSVDWLKALPERFNLQPNPEWSDEDEKMLWSVINGLHSGMYDKEREWLANKFKYLRPKSKVDSVEYERGFLAGQGSIQHWKPTEEQMDVLLSTIKDKHNAARFYSLSSLYNDLKKL